MAHLCDPYMVIDLSNATTVPINMVYTSHEWIIYFLLWPCIIFIGFCSNLTFIWTVIQTPTLQTNTYKYLVSLAVSDLLTLVSVGIPNITYFAVTPLRDRPFAYNLLTMLFFLCSVGTITLVFLERFLAVCHPIKYRLMKGTKRTNIFICLTWVFASCYTLLMYPTIRSQTFCVIWPKHSRYKTFPIHFQVPQASWIFYYVFTSTYCLLFIFLLIFNSYLYIRIYLVMRRRTTQNLNSSADVETQLHQVILMIIINGIVFFVFCLAQIQLMVMAVIFNIFSKTFHTTYSTKAGIASYIFFGINSSINPIIYLTINKTYRNAFKMVFIKGNNQRK